MKGFQRMSVARRQEVARAGGRAAQAQGVAHRWTHEEARLAGKKGGEAKRANAESALRRKV